MDKIKLTVEVSRENYNKAVESVIDDIKELAPGETEYTSCVRMISMLMQTGMLDYGIIDLDKCASAGVVLRIIEGLLLAKISEKSSYTRE